MDQFEEFDLSGAITLLRTLAEALQEIHHPLSGRGQQVCQDALGFIAEFGVQKAADEDLRTALVTALEKGLRPGG